MMEFEEIVSALRTELEIISTKWRAERKRLYELIRESQDSEEINSLFDEMRDMFNKQCTDRQLDLTKALTANSARYLN